LFAIVYNIQIQIQIRIFSQFEFYVTHAYKHIDNIVLIIQSFISLFLFGAIIFRVFKKKIDFLKKQLFVCNIQIRIQIRISSKFEFYVTHAYKHIDNIVLIIQSYSQSVLWLISANQKTEVEGSIH